MASVNLQFIPPDRDDIVKLHIYEAPDLVSGLVPIEHLTEIGTFPDYITEYSTSNAANVNDYFAIQWEDSKGAFTDMSPRIKGGMSTLLGEIFKRVRQYDPMIDERTALYQTEGAMESYFGKDPYSADFPDIAAGHRYRVLNGIAYLAMARAYLVMAATHNQVESASIGMLSFRTSGSKTNQVNVNQLIDLANEVLGWNTSLILQLEDVYNPSAAWQVWFEDWQVNWDQIPWIKGIFHWELPTSG